MPASRGYARRIAGEGKGGLEAIGFHRRGRAAGIVVLLVLLLELHPGQRTAGVHLVQVVVDVDVNGDVLPVGTGDGGGDVNDLGAGGGGELSSLTPGHPAGSRGGLLSSRKRSLARLSS